MPGMPIANTAARASAVAKATNAVRNPRSVPSGAGFSTGINLRSTVIVVSNDGEDPIKAGEPVLIKKSAIVDPDTDRAEWRNCAMIDEGSNAFEEGIVGIWGIALQLIEPGFAGPVLMSGITTVTVTKRRGEDLMVDMPCFRDDEDTERKLYTSAAGCAVILDIPELEDDAEGEAIVHVLGYRTTEPPTWAELDGWIHLDDNEDDESTPLAYVRRRGPAGGWNNVPGRYTAARQVECRCFKIGSTERLQGFVELSVDPWRGTWNVRDALNCPEQIPVE
jgi:hypothetical protein